MTWLQSAAIVSTGTEILQGLYADTNARYLSEQLSAIGVDVKVIMAAPDNEREIEATLAHAAQRADLVVCSGGLGPTEDDLNRYVFARLLQRELVTDDRALEMMRARFLRRVGGEMPVGNEVQALVPLGCKVLYNDWGTAPGFFIRREKATGSFPAALVALPGPPSELIPMFERQVLPLLLSEIGLSAKCTIVRTLHTFGRPESEINHVCRDLFHTDPNVRLTILAKPYGVDLRLFTTADCRTAAMRFLDTMEAQIRSRIPVEELYGTDDATLPAAVAELLITKQLTVSVAESCTGGWISKLLTDVPGSSAYLKQAYIVYSDQAKTSILGVPEEIIRENGAVSEQVAWEMAERVRLLSHSSYGIAVTGIAGPGGATPAKPLGLTWIALADSAGTETKRFVFSGEREQNRFLAAQSALWMLRRRLLRNSSS